jgi:Uma2 family endonuclease
MASTIVKPATAVIAYPDSDGKPMAETPLHRRNLTDLVETLDAWFAPDPMVYVSGNMLMYYIEDNPRRHVSPDVFVVKGIPKLPERRHFLVWKEGKGPDAVIELSSPSTEKEDLERKFELYRDLLKVSEYFLFDPYGESLVPPLVGFRLSNWEYEAIAPVNGRLPSEVLGLHLERDGWQLRLYDPAAGAWLLVPREEGAARRRAEAAQSATDARLREETQRRQQAEAEIERLRRELDALKRAAKK